LAKEKKMEVKTTLKVLNQADIPAQSGVTEGQTLKQLVGNAQIPTDRVRVAFATYQPGTVEKLHWHPIEALYFIHTGAAVVRDIEGREYNVGPGSVIYAPAGIAGAHEWEVKESMTLLAVRATTDPARKFQFTVDKDTKRSYIELDELARRGGVSFESHY
jgi:mannose-6-phosphate isomerase-like protein (cupin superfamily)